MRWIAQHLSSGGIVAADWIANKVHTILANDATLQGIFGGAAYIRWVDVYLPVDFDHFPQLLVTPGLLSDTPQPASRKNEVTIYLIARFLLTKNDAMRPAEAGLASLWSYVTRLLLSTGNLQLNHRHPTTGVFVQTVQRSYPGEITGTVEREDDGGGFACRSVLSWHYETRVDPATLEIMNLQG